MLPTRASHRESSRQPLGPDDTAAAPFPAEQNTMTKLVVVDNSTLLQRAKLDEITMRINQASRKAAFDLVYAVGAIIIKELYGGDLSAWGRQGTRAPSYQQLAARNDLVLSPSALCRAVGIYALCERNGGRGSWPHLAASHFQEVLALDPKQQARLLGIAESEGWTVSRLRTEISKQRPTRNRGRRHSLMTSVRDLRTFFVDRQESLFDTKGIRRLDARNVAEVMETLGIVRQELERLEKLLAATPRNRPPTR
jgi:hypothetical protein